MTWIPFLGGVQINVVQAHRAHADDLQVLGGIQDVLVDGRIDAHDEHVILRDQLEQLLLGRQHMGVHLHVLAQLFRDRAVDGVDDQAFHDKQSSFLNVWSFSYFDRDCPLCAHVVCNFCIPFSNVFKS